MNTENNIHIYEDAAVLSAAAAGFITKIIRQAIDRQGRCSVALSGGNTPQSVYALLATLPFRDEIDWTKTFFFWGDERCVPPDDSRNNAYHAKKILLSQVPVPAGNIFPVCCYDNPQYAARSYETDIRHFFGETYPRFDLILLGLGENGHTASLFPGNEKALTTEELVVNVYVPEQDMYRVSMTPSLINNASNILFLVTGTGKSAILAQTLYGNASSEEIPARAIHPVNGILSWLIDQDAASRLPKDLL